MKLISDYTNVWFTADTHYGHKNIVRGVSNWENKDGCRDFNTIDKMNDAIVGGINKYVQQDDVLIHLGDWSMGGINNIWKFRRRLNVCDVFLILGNHDEHIQKNKILPDVFHNSAFVPTINYIAQEVFTNVNNYLELAINNKLIILSHYPITSWNRAYRGSWMLHGHTHDTLFTDENPYTHWYHKSKILDIGMDTAYNMFGEYRPFSFNELKTIMDKRRFISIDQHDKKTNG